MVPYVYSTMHGITTCFASRLLGCDDSEQHSYCYSKTGWVRKRYSVSPGHFVFPSGRLSCFRRRGLRRRSFDSRRRVHFFCRDIRNILDRPLLHSETCLYQPPPPPLHLWTYRRWRSTYKRYSKFIAHVRHSIRLPFGELKNYVQVLTDRDRPLAAMYTCYRPFHPPSLSFVLCLHYKPTHHPSFCLLSRLAPGSILIWLHFSVAAAENAGRISR